MDEPSQYALKKRTIRKNRQRTRQRREKGERDENQFRGPAKEYLKLELLQLLLRHQIKAVQEIWKVSSEIEVIARDVWLLVLSLYPLPEPPKPPEPEQTQPDPFLATSNSRGSPLPGSTSFPINLQYSQSTRSHPGSALRKGHLPRSNTLPDIQSMAKKFDDQLHLNKSTGDGRLNPHGNSDKGTADTGSDDDSTEDDEKEQENDNYGVDKELLDELSESSESSSTDEDERERERELARRTGPGRKSTSQHWRHGKNLGAHKVVTATVVLRILMISLWMMRVPVLLVDVMRLLQSLDVSMTVARPREYSRWHNFNSHMKKKKKALQNGRPLEHDDPQAASDEEEHDIQPRSRRDLPNRRLAELCPVELRLASAIIVVLKLVYGLDGKPRQPASWDDIACEFPIASEWLHEIRTRVEGGWFRRHTIDRQPIDFAYQSAEDVDKFLAQASKVLLGVPNRMADSQQVIDLFDYTSGPDVQLDEQDEILHNWKAFHRGATPNTPPDQQSDDGEERTGRDEGESLLSGHSYKMYDWKASEDDLPEELRLVVQAVAEVIGVSRSAVFKELYALETLVGAVSRRARGEVLKEKRRRSSVMGDRKRGFSGTSGVSSPSDESD
ncbi:hypothetical protein QFC22_001277 [Naganishia vaughanmartiniae]|uniref:Uncharacterized protein n=1 Tax=Naganishia vaughanmartiniae TaxID=1424756 RepID=A0ACC2XII8_9TREE|nr:hypothetical protein QFC22_001277 [Naganishia vaughanmartiniae]